MGIIIASLGQAMQCIVVAPRLLASIAVRHTGLEPQTSRQGPRLGRRLCDSHVRAVCLGQADNMLRIRLPRGIVLTLHPFSKLTAGEPRRALVFTYLFGGCFVLLGSLDVVAPLLSMCFLLCYASMNITVFVLSILEDPHWRPRWRYFHWSVGLAGFLLCCTLMFLINWYFALAAWAVALLILGLIVQVLTCCWSVG